MNRIPALVCAVALFIGIGCSTPSVHSIWSADKNVNEPGLVGAWKQVQRDGSDSDTTYTVAAIDDEKCSLVVTSADGGAVQTWSFEARMVDLGEARFADVALDAQTRHELSDQYGALALPTHMFMKYKLDGDTLKVWTMDRDWLRSLPANQTGTPASTRLDSEAELITAKTAQMQAFLAEHAANTKAWSGEVELKRAN